MIGRTLIDDLTSTAIRLRSGIIQDRYALANLLEKAAEAIRHPFPHAHPLTQRQAELMRYLREYTDDNGYAPSFEEIAAQFHYSSLATVHEHLSNLERKGYLRRVYNQARGIILPEHAAGDVEHREQAEVFS